MSLNLSSLENLPMAEKRSRPRPVSTLGDTQLNLAEVVLRDGRLILFDANTSINQCHIVTLMIAEIWLNYVQSKNLSDEERRFLGLSLATSPCMVRGGGWEALLEKYKPKLPVGSPKKEIEELRKYVAKEQKESEKLNTTASQMAMKAELATMIFDQIQKRTINTPLSSDLRALGDSDLLYLNGQRIKTYPKYAGVIWFLERLKSMANPPPVLVKVKHYNGQNYRLANYLAKRVTDPLVSIIPRNHSFPDEAAIVIEGVSLPKGMKYADYEKVTELCANQLFASVMPDTHQCSACLPHHKSEEWEQSLEGSTIESALLKIGADYTMLNQTPLVEQLSPAIRESLNASMSFAKAEGYSYDNPSKFVIEHIHSDTLKNSLSREVRLLDQRPIDLLKATLGGGS